MTTGADLSEVSTGTLELLRAGIASGAIRTPLDRAALVGSGIQHQLDTIERALGGHKTSACLAVLDVALAERRRRKPAPELVWTGPEGSSSTARDTAVVLRWLFESARETVILAGYSFSHARDVLKPLHASMKAHGVRALFFVNIPQVECALPDPMRHANQCLGEFLSQNWPFGEPFPTLYYDRRALVPGPPFASLHAKCVIVDGERAFISSANFTDRGQDRNIEAGVLIEDPSFAGHLARQWLGLVESGSAHEFRLTHRGS